VKERQTTLALASSVAGGGVSEVQGTKVAEGVKVPAAAVLHLAVAR
jgi:hypothetical protein